jgi:hypothetical protein
VSEGRQQGDLATVVIGVVLGLACAWILRLPACITGEQLPPAPRNPWDIPGRQDSDGGVKSPR